MRRIERRGFEIESRETEYLAVMTPMSASLTKKGGGVIYFRRIVRNIHLRG
jgi:hypothetical protein